jgi:hypothetical protein
MPWLREWNKKLCETEGNPIIFVDGVEYFEEVSLILVKMMLSNNPAQTLAKSIKAILEDEG